jgi:hypothetical protein
LCPSIIIHTQQTQLLWRHSGLHQLHPFNHHPLLHSYSVDSVLARDFDQEERQQEDPIDDGDDDNCSSYDSEYEGDEDDEEAARHEHKDRYYHLPNFWWNRRTHETVNEPEVTSIQQNHQTIKNVEFSEQATEESCRLQGHRCYDKSIKTRPKRSHNTRHQETDREDKFKLLTMNPNLDNLLVISPENKNISMTCGSFFFSGVNSSHLKHCYNNNNGCCYIRQMTITPTKIPQKLLPQRHQDWNHSNSCFHYEDQQHHLKDSKDEPMSLGRRFLTFLSSTFDSKRGRKRGFPTNIMKQESILARKTSAEKVVNDNRMPQKETSKILPSLSSSSSAPNCLIPENLLPSIPSIPATASSRQVIHESSSSSDHHDLLTKRSLENSLTLPFVTSVETTSSSSSTSSTSCSIRASVQTTQSNLPSRKRTRTEKGEASSLASLSCYSSPTQQDRLLDVSSGPSVLPGVVPVAPGDKNRLLPEHLSNTSSFAKTTDDGKKEEVEDGTGIGKFVQESTENNNNEETTLFSSSSFVILMSSSLQEIPHDTASLVN